MLDLEVVKQKQQQTWATGDFAVIGWNTVYPGELLCEAVDLRAGHKILDVAAGRFRPICKMNLPGDISPTGC